MWDDKMSKVKLSVMLSVFVILAGCNSLPMVTQSNDKGGENKVAVLTDYELNDGFITIQAVGYGCTFFNSFKVEVANKNENSLEVIRTRPDNCGMKPRNVSLQYSFKHLGLDLNKNVQVKNQVNISGSEPIVNN